MNEATKREHERLQAVLQLLVDEKVGCGCTNYDNAIAETQRLIANIEKGEEVKATTDDFVDGLLDGVDEFEQRATDVDNTDEQPAKKSRGRKKVTEEVAVD